VVVCGAAAQRRPPNYSLDEMPDIQTSFSCYDKILGGYYSDPETDCQMFHVCVRVAGVGVQDFRFLCPNDTAFDQENQICDDWYNIDCEAATLYYSDNFDLFRLGHEDNNFASVKATAIPLGPSSAPRIAPHPKPRRPHTPINNAVSDSDDDYLQRADAGDKRVSQDLLRGSSSGNFFNNRNGGKEDPDDDYVPSQQELTKSKNKKPNKNQVRKLLTGKRPVTQSSTTEAPSPTTSTTASYYNRYNTVQRNRPTTTTATENYPTTAVPAQTFNNQRYNNPQQAADFNSQRYRNNQNFAFNKKPVTTTEAAQETTTANYNFRGNNFYQQTATAQTYKPTYNQNNNYYQQQSTSTAAPTNYKTNYNQGNNYYQTPTTTAPQYNYNQQTSTPASTVYNPYQNRVSQQTTNQNNNYQNTNYQNTNYQQNTNNYQTYNSPSTVNVNGNYDATTLKQNYYQKQTTANYDNYYKTSTNAPIVAYSTTLAPVSQSFNYDNTNVYQQTKNQYNYNVNAAGTTTVNYNPYNSYKGSNDGYDEPTLGESLKTAPSSNIRPSDLNAIAKSYQKPGGFNASLSASYNFVNPSTTQKPTSKFYNSAKQFQTTKSQTTQKPYQPSPTTVQSPSRGNAYYAQSTTSTSLQPRPFSKEPQGTVAPKQVTKEKDTSYDYAYYDEGTGSEYDGIDTIGEEFSRTTSHKSSRTTPQ